MSAQQGGEQSPARSRRTTAPVSDVVVASPKPPALKPSAPTTGGRNLAIWIVLAMALIAGAPAAIRVVRLR